MKSFPLAIATTATLLVLAGCGGNDNSSDPGATPASDNDSTGASSTEAATDTTTDAAPDDLLIGNYQASLTAVSDLFARLASQENVSPASTEEANAAAGLDDTTDLIFADYTVLPEDESSGSFCLLSVPTETYIAVTYSGGLGEVDLGDGECSYDTDAAVVVGDLETDTWTTGGDLMGDTTPRAVFGS